MPNTDAAFGLRPVGHLYGAPLNAGVRRMFIHGSYATALFIGDPVELATETDYQDTTGKHLSIEIAAAGDNEYISGVIVGFEADKTNLNRQYSPASTEGWAMVNIDPNVIYQIQDNGGGTPDKTWPGSNMVLASGSGSTVTGLSGWELAGATAPAANDSYQVMVLGVSDVENNDLGDNAVWDVIINTHRFARSSTADGTKVGMLGVIAT